MEAASPSAPPKPDPSTRPDHRPRPSVAISWDSQALCRRAESCELKSKAFLIDPALLPTLEGLLLEMYAMLRPKPVDYEQRHIMVDVFNKIAKEIFGKKNGFPVVEAFGSFTMDLFTPKSDLDLSVNFNSDMKGQFARKDKISVIRKLAKVLLSHQRNGLCYGVLPVVTAIVPVLKVIDKGTGIECDISVENKDGMSRSMIFKLISSIDERFQILCYLMKFWAKAHDVNCPKDRTMSSMAIISLVAFHLQTRCPPILPVFSALLKDGSDFASIQRNVSLSEGFGSRNKESLAELFVSLMNNLLSVEGLWEQGLCASNFEGLWISKTWERGVGNLSVEDFLDRSQNFARSVGKVEMQKICECLRVTVLNLTDFFRGKIDAPKLKTLLFGPLNPDEPVSYPIPKRAKRKGDSIHDPENSQKQQKRVKQKHTVHTGCAANTTAAALPPPSQKKQKTVNHTVHPSRAANTTAAALPPPSQKKQKKVNHTVHPSRAANTTAAALPPPSQKHQESVNHTVHPGRAANTTAAALPPPSQKKQKKVNHTVHPSRAANTTAAALPPPSQKHQESVNHTVHPGRAANTTAAALPPPSQKKQKKVNHTVHPSRAANTTAAALPPPSQKHQKSVNHTVHPGRAANTTAAALPPPSQKHQESVNHTVHPGRAANTTAAALPPPSQKKQKKVNHTVHPSRAANTTAAALPPPSQKHQKSVNHTVHPGRAANTTAAALPPPSQKKQKIVNHTVHPSRAANTTAAALPPPSQKKQKKVNHTVHPSRAANTTAAALPPPSQKHQKRVNHTVHPGRAANTTAAALPPPTVSVRPRMHQLGPTQPSTQFAHISQHLITPSRFAYGLPPPHLHSAPHSSQGLLGQQQGNLIHLNPGIQLQQQAQHMFVPSLVHQPVINMFNPYVLNGDHHIQQHNENRMMQRIPYGTNPNYWR